MKLSNINREILALSIPAIVSNITTPLLGLIDVAIVGHIGSAVYIAAIALGGAVMNMLYWIFGFLRLGASGVTAQAFGAKDTVAADAVLYRGLVIAAGISLLIMVAQGFLTDRVLEFMDADPASANPASRYVSICIWGAPSVLATYTLSGWMLGMQYSKGPMWIALVTNIVNIAASLIFVFWLGYDIAGVATGTCIAQWAGIIFGAILTVLKFHPSHPDWKKVFKAEDIKRFFAINRDIFLRTLCLVAVTLWFTHAGAVQGTLVLAANALLMQFFMFFSYFTDGFAFAGEALSGKYMGERNPDMLKKSIESLIKTGVVLSVIFTTAYFIAGDTIMHILTSDSGVVDTAKKYFIWILVIPVAGFTAFTWDGIFGGLTLTRGGLLLPMALSAMLFFASYALLTPLYGNHGLWASFIIYCASRGIIQTIYFQTHKKYLYRNEQQGH